MKEIITQDLEKIIREIITLSEKKLPLTFIQKGHAPRTIYVKGIETRNNLHKIVVFTKKEPFTPPLEPSLVFYHPTAQPMRGFEVHPVNESQHQLEAKIPQQIVQIQRRKHPRFMDKGNSSALFACKGGSVVYSVTVKDICLEGARLSGTFSAGVKKGDILAPLTLNLRLVHGEYQEKIFIPEAKVQWVNNLPEGQRTMGIHFTLADDEFNRLDTYLNVLSVAEEDL